MKHSIVLLCAVCLAACAGRGVSKQKTDTRHPATYGYKIVRTYPHPTDAYTQGLFWHEGMLYESTGEYGRSKLRQAALETGEAVREAALSDDYFAEGAALLGGKIYQLTWLEETAFVYDAATLERTGELAYKGQGWGLTTDGTNLYMSDGTPNITVRDPVTFHALRTIAVRDSGIPVRMINELEWIEGKIWANIYLTDRIVVIDPADGHVESIVDFTGIRSRLTITPETDVMNGIAHDPATGRIFVTGKNWNSLFEVETVKK